MNMYGFGAGKGLDEIAYSKASDKGYEIRDLKDRLEKLEKYIGVEWREDKGKYYKPSVPAKPKEEFKGE